MMAGDGGRAAGGEPPQLHQPAQPPSFRLPGRTPKEGEKILAPTRRPDGTLRKPIRIRAGYVPQDEVAIYQSKGALLKKAAQLEVPPGYDPVLDAKPKTRSAKRNERKKEKRHQAALAAGDKGKKLDSVEVMQIGTGEFPSADLPLNSIETMKSLTSQITVLSVSEEPSSVGPSPDSRKISNPVVPDLDLDKKIQALKKKIRLEEARQKGDQQSLNAEQLEKLAKVEGWREKLKLLEGGKAALVS